MARRRWRTGSRDRLADAPHFVESQELQGLRARRRERLESLSRLQVWVQLSTMTGRQAALQVAAIVLSFPLLGATLGAVAWVLLFRSCPFVFVMALCSVFASLLGLFAVWSDVGSEGRSADSLSRGDDLVFCRHGVLFGLRGKRCMVCIGLMRLRMADIEEELDRLGSDIDRVYQREQQRFELDLATRRRRLANLESLRSMDPFDFEVLVCRLYRSMGFEANYTPKSGDKGVDVHAIKGDRRFAIQCKRYGFGSVVSGEEIQKLYGAMRQAGCHSAILVTTGRFSASAVEAARLLKVEMVDGERLVKLIIENLDGLSG
jgi:Holliday junction resolvase